MRMKVLKNHPQLGIFKGQVVNLDRDYIKSVDIKNNRVRMMASEREALTRIQAADSLILANLRDMKRIGKETNAYNLIAGAERMLRSALSMYTVRCSLLQILSMEEQLNNQKVVVSHTPCLETVNLPVKTVSSLVLDNQLNHCRNCLKCLNKAEWQGCSWKNLFDLLPCDIREQSIDETACPYVMMGDDNNG